MAVNTPQRPEAPDGLCIYARTARGDQLLAAPPHGFDRASLRLLSLIDGQRSFAALLRFARGDEVARIVARLEERNYIVRHCQARPPDEQTQREQLASNAALLAHMKEELAGIFSQELGTTGAIWEARIEDCVSLEVLRRVLREAIDTLYARGHDASAQRVIALVKPLFRRAHPGTAQ